MKEIEPLLPERLAEVKTLSTKDSVLTAKDRLTGLDVIVKCAEAEDSSLAREAEILRRFDSDSVPHVVDIFTCRSRSFLVLERIHWKSLDSVLRAKHVPPKQLKQFLLRVSEPICKLNELGFLYRDFAAFHVLCSPRFEVKWIDFGNCIGPLKGDGTIANPHTQGFWRTMAPEEFVIGALLTTATNVYSLACVFCFISSGKYPLDHITTTEAGIKTYHASPKSGSQRNPTLKKVRPPALAKIIKTATSIAPEDRYSSVNEMVGEIERSL